MAGIAPAGAGTAVLRETLVENLRYASRELGRAGIRLLIEPINTRDMPGFYLNGSAQALDIIASVGSDNLFLQYDVYHMQEMEGDLAATITRVFKHIKHVQVADHPGRREPGTGNIDYPVILAHLDRLGYDGWIGAEYKPATTTADGLAWLARLSA